MPAPLNLTEIVTDAVALQRDWDTLLERVVATSGQVMVIDGDTGPEAALMSTSTLDALLQLIAGLEDDLLLARAESIVRTGYDPIAPDEVEGPQAI